MKDDEHDVRDLADQVRLGRLAEAWVAPPKTVELREMIRFRIKLSHVRTGLKAQVHAIMAKNGICRSQGDMWGSGGDAQLDSHDCPTPSAIASPCSATSSTPSTARSSSSTANIHLILCDDAGYNTVQAIYGVGHIFAAVAVAEHRHLPERMYATASRTALASPIHRSNVGRSLSGTGSDRPMPLMSDRMAERNWRDGRGSGRSAGRPTGSRGGSTTAMKIKSMGSSPTTRYAM